MSNKAREFDVELVDSSNTQLDVVVNKKVVGSVIDTQTGDFRAVNVRSQNLGSAHTQEIAIQMVISDFNLNN
ncbi:MAG: DUF2969 domain-containing protein [Lactobacillaceae bacterium]|jgi:hypothetical protein|nr:DUF2969 domain-containing protein [Lactobacillaceae bacterium]